MKERLRDIVKNKSKDTDRTASISPDLYSNLEKDKIVVEQSLPYLGIIDISHIVQKLPVSTVVAIQNLIDTAKVYAEGIIIKDTFGNDHGARRQYRDQMRSKYAEEYRKLDDSNKLRGNVIQPIYWNLQLLILNFNTQHIDTPLSKSICALMKELPDMDTYGEMSLEEKLDIVAKIDHVARSFLEIFSRKD